MNAIDTLIRTLPNPPSYGCTPGICRITGKKSIGIPFSKWIKPTFNDLSYLFPGDIISNEALFTFDEKSEYIQQILGKDKPQRFRTYSHIIHQGKWHLVTKGDKPLIFNLICDGAEVVCLTDTGQKHLFFKHKPGFWQLDDLHIMPDLTLFKKLHSQMVSLMKMGLSQTEIISGSYQSYKLLKIDIKAWKQLEESIKPHRGSSLFSFASWMLFLP